MPSIGTIFEHHAWARYGFAILVVAIAVIIRWPLYPILGDHRPYLTLFGAVAVVVSRSTTNIVTQKT
jgi:hypothetical protein